MACTLAISVERRRKTHDAERTTSRDVPQASLAPFWDDSVSGRCSRRRSAKGTSPAQLEDVAQVPYRLCDP